jgi:Phasin protein
MTAQRARSNYTDNVTPFTSAFANGHSGQSMIQGAEALFATFAMSQREMLDFVSMRLEKDSEAIRELTSSHNWADALTVQSRWVQETIRDYTAEAAKLLALYTKTGRDMSLPQRGR